MTTAEQPARLAAQLVRRSRIGMLLGWSLSMIGSEVFAGASPALIVTSALPVAWMAGYSTLTSIQDMASPLVVRPLGRLRPGRVLVACECYDVALLLTTLAAMALGAPIGITLAAYMVLASPIPLVLDVVEEIYGAEMATIDAETSFRFTSHLHSLSAFFSAVLSVPLGAYLTFLSPYLVVLINLVLSGIAIGARLGGVRAEEKALRLTHASAPPQDSEEHLFPSTPAALRHLLARPLISPPSILARSFATALAGGYVLIHLGQERGEKTYLMVLIAVGLGATAGPQIARLARRLAGAGKAAVIAGGWSAVALRTTTDPHPALIGAALLHAALAGYLWWGLRSGGGGRTSAAAA